MRRLGLPILPWLCLLPLSCGDGPTDASPVEVRADVRTLVDESRATPPNNGFPGEPTRILETRLWLTSVAQRARPGCGGDRCALVVLAHGYGGSTARFDAIARGLAEAGYVVAAPRFPLTNEAAPGGHLSGLGNTVEQPADLSFVIDRLQAASADRGDPLLGGRIDPERVAVLGHSLGGVTALAHSRASCCTDARIDAVVLVAPVTDLVDALFRESLDPRGLPTLAMSGTLDPFVRPDVPAELYDEIQPPKAHLLLEGASHADLIENTGPAAPILDVTRRAVVAFLDEFLGDGHELATVLDEIRAEGHTARWDLGG